MHLQVLSSGSQGNVSLVRGGETSLLIDAGLPLKELDERFEAARFYPQGLDHVLVSHGHLDHTRSAGLISRRERATLHCVQAVQRNGAIRRSKRLATLPISREFLVTAEEGRDAIAVRAIPIPHDAVPTLAFRLEQAGRVLVHMTDMGHPDPRPAEELQGAHLILIEFNHDPEMLANGPYPAPLRKRIRGNGGHLSNEQAAEFLARIAGPELHTVVLAHLSLHNNTPELAESWARSALRSKGLDHVRVEVASQHEVGPNLEV